MYGVFASHTVRMSEEDALYSEIINMYKLDAKFSYGQVDYTSTSGTVNNIPDFMVEFRGVMGKDFYPNQQWLFTPYAGLGFRWLDDEFASTHASGTYQRVARYLYAPIGLEISHQLNSSWRLGGTGEFDIFFYGRQTSNLSDVDLSLPDVNNSQRRGFGLRGSLKLVKEGEKVDFNIEPFVRYWHIKDSDVAEGYYEPNNTSTEFGVKLGVQFAGGKNSNPLLDE